MYASSKRRFLCRGSSQGVVGGSTGAVLCAPRGLRKVDGARVCVRKTEYLAIYRNTVKTELAKLEAEDDDVLILRVRYTRCTCTRSFIIIATQSDQPPATAPSPRLLSSRTHSRLIKPPYRQYATPSPIARPWRHMQHADSTLSVLRPTRSRSTASYGVRGLRCPSIEIGSCRPLQGRLAHH